MERSRLMTPWAQVALGILPLLLAGVGSVLTMAPIHGKNIIPLIGGIMLGMTALAAYPGLLAGWLRGFPRWSLGYLMYAMLVPLFLTNSSTPGLSIFGIPIWGRALWGWRAWVLLGLTVLLAVVLQRDWARNLGRLLRGFWQDWTRLAFCLFSIIIYVPFVILDEMSNTARFPYAAGAVAVLLLAGIFWLRVGASPAGVAALVGGAFAGVVASMVGAGLYWQFYTIDTHTGRAILRENATPNAAEAILPGLAAGAIISALLIAPGILGVLRYLLRRRGSPQG